MQKLAVRRRILPLLIPCGVLILVFLLVQFLIRAGSPDRKFQAETEKFFAEEITSTTINLHYTLADPAAAGIEDYPITLGAETSEEDDPSLALLEHLVRSFREEDLNEENQRIYRLLEDDLENREALAEFPLLQEVLSPSLGVQAQLPVLLCEYAFRTKQDILDYLGLLKEIPACFRQILEFEEQKARGGYFMNDAAAEGVIAQCRAFLEDPPSSSLLESSFRQKLSEFSGLTQEERSSCLALHARLLETCVYPAYRSLIDELNDLKGSGKNENGLCGLPGGRDYYCWLLRSQVGTSDTPEEICGRLLQQLQEDSREMQSLLSQDPSLLSRAQQESPQTPEEILETLQDCINEDFPGLPETAYQIKYVDEALADHLSPAFYLTPPADTNAPNSIYLNPAADLEGIELFTTLAHEGFPGHLYQTVYFASTEPQLIRYLYEPGGYVEGWATYIESYAFSYADIDPALSRLLWLNRSINLCLYSLMDLGIHYNGWTAEDTAAFLAQAGMADASAAREIHQYIIETPANYLKYYYGYLHFLDLREAVKAREGDSFDLKAFHRELLELGPMPFYLLEEEMGAASVYTEAAQS